MKFLSLLTFSSLQNTSGTSDLVLHLNEQLRTFREWTNNEGSEASFINAVETATGSGAPTLFPESLVPDSLVPSELQWRPRVTVLRKEVEGHFTEPLRMPFPVRHLTSPARLKAIFGDAVADEENTFKLFEESYENILADVAAIVAFPMHEMLDPKMLYEDEEFNQTTLKLESDIHSYLNAYEEFLPEDDLSVSEIRSMVGQLLTVQMKEKLSKLSEEDRVKMGIQVLQLLREFSDRKEVVLDLLFDSNEIFDLSQAQLTPLHSISFPEEYNFLHVKETMMWHLLIALNLSCPETKMLVNKPETRIERNVWRGTLRELSREYFTPPKKVSASFATTSPVHFLAHVFKNIVFDILVDSSNDEVAFHVRLKEAAAARASYCRQKWEGKIHKGMDMVTQLVLQRAMDMPPDLFQNLQGSLEILNKFYLEQTFYMESRSPDQLDEMQAEVHEKLQRVEDEIAAEPTNLSEVADLEALPQLNPFEEKRLRKLLKPHAEAALLAMILTDIKLALWGVVSSSLVPLSSPSSVRLAHKFIDLFHSGIDEFAYKYIERYVKILSRDDNIENLEVNQHIRFMRNGN